MFRRALHGTVAALLALTTLVVAGHSLLGLDDCYSRLEVEARVPGCCHHTKVDTLEDVHHSCCQVPFVADLEDASLTGAMSDIPAAMVAAAAPAPLPRLAFLDLGASGFHPVLERPPDRAPPTRTTVLVV